jgi:hypothetical protein
MEGLAGEVVQAAAEEALAAVVPAVEGVVALAVVEGVIDNLVFDLGIKPTPSTKRQTTA